MKFLLDFFPIGLFFIVYKTLGLYAAIYAMIVATIVQMLVTRWQSGKFENAQLITFALLVVFGGITLALRDPAFVMWKVSVLYAVFSLLLVGSIWIGKKPLLQRMLGKQLSLPKNAWHQLTWVWGLGFSGIALVNGYYVKIALAARSALFSATQIDSNIELTTLDCKTTIVKQLCINAQQSEESWVNFKLFGTMGLTFVLIIISIIFISKYIKTDKQ